MRRELPSGTVTFLFTDIEGSTRLLRELGPDEYAAALGEHRRLLRETFVDIAALRLIRKATRSSWPFPAAPAQPPGELWGECGKS